MDLKIALVQTDLAWKDKSKNLSTLTQLVNGIQEQVDIIVFSELFNTAFCVDDLSLAEDENGATFSFMKKISKQNKCAVCGSFLFKENEHYFNRFFFTDGDEILGTYDKHFLFSLVGENKQLQQGKEKILIEYKNWKIQPFICYDIRFPAWCQNDANADVQLYVASWPKKRIHHWQTLLQARAIENQCYTVGVNRIGFDFYGNEHNGHSAVYDFTGNLLVDLQQKDGIEIAILSKEKLEEHKTRYPFWKDRK